MKTKRMKAIRAGGIMVALLGFAAGCGEDAQTDSALAVYPATSTVYADGATVFLTVYDPDENVYEADVAAHAKASLDSDVDQTNTVASQILLPLEWSVANPAMGRIMAVGGYSAVYESYGPRGQNYVAVRDQAGREGIAAIEQRWHEGDPEEEGTSAEEEE